MKPACFPLAALPLLVALAEAASTPVTPQVSGAWLTLRAGAKATVLDRRTVTLTEGEFELPWEAVSRRLVQDSLQLRFPDAPVVVVGQRYEQQPATREAWLKQYIDHPIEIVRKDSQGHELERTKGVLLAVEGGHPSVVRLDSGALVLNPPGEVLLPPCPEVTPPGARVVWNLRSLTSGSRTAELTYVTDGLSWKANYVLTLTADLTRARVSGWVTVTNSTGVTFRDAHLRLEAVETRKVQALQPVLEKQTIAYPLPGLTAPLTLAADKPLRTPLVTDRTVTVQRGYVFDPLGATPAGPTPPQKLKKVVRLKNRELATLGSNLPGGHALVYEQSAGGVRLLADLTLPAAGSGQDVEISLGTVSNLEGERKQTAFRAVAPRVQEQNIEIRLNNKSGEWVEAFAVEHPWPQFKITHSSHPYTTRPDKALEFAVMLAPQSVTTVTYTVQMAY